MRNTVSLFFMSCVHFIYCSFFLIFLFGLYCDCVCKQFFLLFFSLSLDYNNIVTAFAIF